jgi:hypothetical protein
MASAPTHLGILARTRLECLAQARSLDAIGAPDATFPQDAYSSVHIGSQDIEDRSIQDCVKGEGLVEIATKM